MDGPTIITGGGEALERAVLKGALLNAVSTLLAGGVHTESEDAIRHALDIVKIIDEKVAIFRKPVTVFPEAEQPTEE